MKIVMGHRLERRMDRRSAWHGRLKSLVGASFVVMTFPIFAASTFCERRANEANRNKADFYVAIESRVTTASGVWLHSAPHARCRRSGEFIKSGVYLPAYSLYRGWVFVMVVRADGETPMGWIRERDLTLLKPYGASKDNMPGELNAK